MSRTHRATARRTTSIGAALVMVILGVAALWGCAAQHDDEAHPAPTEQPRLLTYAVTQDEDQLEMEALWQGQLEVDEHSGYIQGAISGGDHDPESEPKPVGMVFPEGTEVTSDGTEILLPSGSTIPIGSEVSLSGGFFPSAPTTPSPNPGYDEYFMVNGAPE